MEGFCRGCLIKYDEPMALLQYTEKNRRLFVYCTGLQVKRNDNFTFQLCKDCFLNMKLACKFKKLCRTSDKRFKNYLALKDVGDPMDFCTFLKNNDDTMTFRLPMISGNSTPANQKCRDDDNESTCTSIRNFMTDILQGEEMPDTEARIIREVIEEEADVLDDSLDSHWLQEDMSMDTDFRLDFSFSPFSTPRSINNDRCFTPKKFAEHKEEHRHIYTMSSEKQNEIVNDFTNAFKNDQNGKELCDYSLPSIDQIDGIEKPESNIILPSLEDVDKAEINTPNFYVSKDQIKPIKFSNEINNDDSFNIESVENDKPCTIDKNLEEALKNEHNKEFSLDDLLVSPPVFQGASAASTPTITNILFGEKLDIVTTNVHSKLSQCIETFENVQSDIEIFEEFFQNDTREFDINDIKKNNVDINKKDDEPISLDNIEIGNGENKLIDIGINIKKNNVDIKKEDDKELIILDNIEIGNGESKLMDIDINTSINENDQLKNKTDVRPVPKKESVIKKIDITTALDSDKLDLENFFCKLCSKKFMSSKALCIHFAKYHQIKIIKPKDKSYQNQLKVCNSCGKQFSSNYISKHLKLCQKSKENLTFKCDHCPIECSSQQKLDRHKSIHTGIYTKKNTGKAYVCTICGVTISKIGNYKLHIRRHTNDYTMWCAECGKGFYRLSEYKDHVTLHTGDRPHPCALCTMSFRRRDVLLRHIRYHTGEKRYQCDHCSSKYTTRSDLKSHVIRCMKKQMLKGREKKIDNDTETKEEVTVTYTTGDANSIRNQLPFLETEMSN